MKNIEAIRDVGLLLLKDKGLLVIQTMGLLSHKIDRLLAPVIVVE